MLTAAHQTRGIFPLGGQVLVIDVRFLNISQPAGGPLRTAARMAKDYLKIYESLADPLTHKTNAHNSQEHPDHLNRKIWKQHAINQ